MNIGILDEVSAQSYSTSYRSGLLLITTVAKPKRILGSVTASFHNPALVLDFDLNLVICSIELVGLSSVAAVIAPRAFRKGNISLTDLSAFNMSPTVPRWGVWELSRDVRLLQSEDGSRYCIDIVDMEPEAWISPDEGLFFGCTGSVLSKIITSDRLRTRSG